LGLSLGYQSVFIMCWCAAMMAMLIYWILYRYLRKQHPSIADAS
jgi:hypothetical protein